MVFYLVSSTRSSSVWPPLFGSPLLLFPLACACLAVPAHILCARASYHIAIKSFRPFSCVCPGWRRPCPTCPYPPSLPDSVADGLWQMVSGRQGPPCVTKSRLLRMLRVVQCNLLAPHIKQIQALNAPGYQGEVRVRRQSPQRAFPVAVRGPSS